MATLPNLPTPKNSGLAQLADTANQQQGIHHYPVRRRGLPRALLPNWDAIAWLEADQAATEIEYTETSETDGLIFTFAIGRTGKSYPRPMFQVIHDGALSAFRGIGGTACPCGDFSRTAYCDEHGELDYDWNRRQWIRPGTSIWYEHHPEDRPGPVEPLPTVYTDTGQRPPNAPPGGLYDRMIEMFSRQLPAYDDEVLREERRRQASLSGQWVTTEQIANFGTSRCTCSMCWVMYADRDRARRQGQPTPAGDPNAGRPGFHYDALTDRWLRDTSDALGDFRAGGPAGTPVSNPENPALTFDRVPDTLLQGNYSEWVDRVLGLQSGTIRIEGVFGEGTITFETEEDAGGDTRTT